METRSPGPLARALFPLFLLCAAGCLRGTNVQVTASLDAATLAAIGAPIASLQVRAESQNGAILGEALISAADGAPIFDPADIGAEPQLRKTFVLEFKVTPDETVIIHAAGYTAADGSGIPVIAGRAPVLLSPRDDGSTNFLALGLGFACANGSLEPGEECDDGNAEPGDGCDALCDLGNDCGNGTVDAGEECDAGPANSQAPNAACRITCTLPDCGDGIEDGAPTAPGQPAEACDDGNAVNTDACVGACQDASCGDGFTQAGVEACDDANASNTDACTNVCEDAACGDGFVQSGEQCDDGGTANGDGCDAACQNEGAVCGNNSVEAGEQCDDGNLTDGDGCDSNCTDTACGNGIVTAPEQCDDGAANSQAPDAACRVDCSPQRCGDNVLDTGEVCDDGNNTDGDGCNAVCSGA
jgi:cysteine-rich repeat protein